MGSTGSILPTSSEIRRAWRGDLAPLLGGGPRNPGFHDTALFEPTRPPGHWAFSRLRFLTTLNLIASLPGKDVFDVAAGPCFMAAALHAAGKRVTANDLRPVREALDVWGAGAAVRLLTGDIFAHTPEATGRFDVVLCSEVIEHVAHPDRLLAHLRTFLRPGGHLVVTTPNGRFAGSRLPTFSEIGDASDLERRQYQPDAEGHLFLLTPAELRALFEGAGMAVESMLLLGSPAMTGHLKVRHLGFLGPSSLWYLAERSMQAAPAPVRERLFSHIVACGRAA